MSSSTSTTGSVNSWAASIRRSGNSAAETSSSERTASAGTAPALASAARTYGQNLAGSPSRASTVSQATRPTGDAAALDAQATVFPAPAGPDTSVTRWAAARSISSVTRRRRSTVRLSRGICSLPSRNRGWPLVAALTRCGAACFVALVIPFPPKGAADGRSSSRSLTRPGEHAAQNASFVITPVRLGPTTSPCLGGNPAPPTPAMRSAGRFHPHRAMPGRRGVHSVTRVRRPTSKGGGCFHEQRTGAGRLGDRRATAAGIGERRPACGIGKRRYGIGKLTAGLPGRRLLHQEPVLRHLAELQLQDRYHLVGLDSPGRRRAGVHRGHLPDPRPAVGQDRRGGPRADQRGGPCAGRAGLLAPVMMAAQHSGAVRTPRLTRGNAAG